MRLDLALEVNKSDAITSQSSVGAKAYFNKWAESNKLCMMIMRLSMDKTIKNSIPQCDNAKDYLAAAVSKKFVVFDKAEKSNYMRLLTTTTYDGTTGVREHVMRMTNLAMRLRDMKVDIPDSYLVWRSNCDATGGEMRVSKTESAHMVTHNHSEGERKFYKGNRNNQNGNKGGNFNNSKPQFKHKNEDMKGKCFWCRKKGHVKKDCNRFKNWLEKKGTPLALVYFESNLVDVPLNSWWIDTGASIHVTNSLQGFKSKRRPNDGEVAVYMGNGEKALVEFIGVVNLPLASGGALVLDDVVYVPSLRRSLISVSKLDSSGFVFHFDFQTCVDCVKGKITRARKKGATRNKGLLEIIHTDICGPFTSAILGGYKYFITFIDHFSHYGYILLIQEKSEALDMFKIYKAEIELKREKIVRSGWVGEFYDRYGFKGNIVDHCIYRED
uniref:CCHC-type domain-containing protein n=1 Tax=Fagus sylvatica TaxID=28930 RepID=A0A2N9II69_FAGSY